MRAFLLFCMVLLQFPGPKGVQRSSHLLLPPQSVLLASPISDGAPRRSWAHETCCMQFIMHAPPTLSASPSLSNFFIFIFFLILQKYIVGWKNCRLGYCRRPRRRKGLATTSAGGKAPRQRSATGVTAGA
uniref:Secreted protein n=1 Tax=Setaria viridis TaxID=4556 RepID=A0A4U6UAL1_SETVI|nr:hypothetical protein SEVIR_5G065380v2 [Setaria viridis]